MQAITIFAILSCLAVPALAGTRVTYTSADKDGEFVRLVRIVAAVKPAAIEESARVYSPHRTRWLRVEVSDGGTVPYDQRVGRVDVDGADGVVRTITFSSFKHHTVRWINEELVHVQVWHGRLLATEHIFDVPAGKPIYQKTAAYAVDAD